MSYAGKSTTRREFVKDAAFGAAGAAVADIHGCYGIHKSRA